MTLFSISGMFNINTEECVQFARWLVFRVYAWRRMVKKVYKFKKRSSERIVATKKSLDHNEIQKAEHASWAEGTA